MSSIIPQQHTTPVSTRKRKRLVHKKSGLKRHEEKSKFTYLTKKPHVSFHKDAKTMSSSASEITAHQVPKVKRKKMVSKPVRQSTLKEPETSHDFRVQESSKEPNQGIDDTQPVSAIEDPRDILGNVRVFLVFSLNHVFLIHFLCIFLVCSNICKSWKKILHSVTGNSHLQYQCTLVNCCVDIVTFWTSKAESIDPFKKIKFDYLFRSRQTTWE